MLAQRFLRSPRGKHCNSLKRNLWHKVVSTSKITILVKIITFAAILSEIAVGNIDIGVVKNREICSKI